MKRPRKYEYSNARNQRLRFQRSATFRIAYSWVPKENVLSHRILFISPPAFLTLRTISIADSRIAELVAT